MTGITNSLFLVVSCFPQLPTMTRLMTFRALAAELFISLLLGVSCAMAVEHPGSLPKDANCTSCHATKVTGKFVHSAMQSPCDVCHVSSTQGDMTVVSLSMPKNRICYACHEAESALRLHTSSITEPCLECHDAHSSEYRMLLRQEVRHVPLIEK